MKYNLDKNPPKGIQKKIYKEAASYTKVAIQQIKSNPDIYKLLEKQVQENENLEKMYNLCAVFSVMTGLAMEWSKRETLIQLAMGAFLQKIGTTQLAQPCFTLSEEDQNDPKLVSEYQRHPFFGARVLGTNGDFPEVVKQIVYQRYELYNGNGYPNGVSGFKIFPPARMVALASDFVEIMVIHNMEPLAALRKLLNSPKTASNYDPDFIRGLVGTFNKKDPKKLKKK